MKVQVECYAGRIADERPVRFRLEGHEYMVEEVLDQWYGPEHVFFKVRADDNNLYILKHRAEDDAWTLDSFRCAEDENTPGHPDGVCSTFHDNPEK